MKTLLILLIIVLAYASMTIKEDFCDMRAARISQIERAINQ